jgi:uncharacterized protein (TIGR01244 family)
MRTNCAPLILSSVLVGTPIAGLVARAETLAQAPAMTKQLPGVTNYTRPDATVGCAGAITADAVPAIKAEGFKSIVNLRMANEPGADVEKQAAAAREAGLRYIHLPFSAAAPTAKVFDEFLAAAADPANSPMFIHCASANRVGAVWLVKRVKQDGWTVERALEEATAIGLSHPALRKFALDYAAGR